MLIKGLGIFDIIVGIVLLFIAVIPIPIDVLAFMGLILLGKSSLGMFKDAGSLIDLFSAIVIFANLIAYVPILSEILGILLIQKGVFSLF